MYNNPNFFQYPNINFTKKSIFNFSEILNKTQKTLNIINQAIPIFYQVKPLWNNTKTILKIANIMNEPKNSNAIPNNNQTTKKTNNTNSNSTEKEIKYNEPVFFL